MNNESPNLNRILLAGKVVDDPYTELSPSGLLICTLHLAVTRKFTKRGTDEKIEETCQFECTVFGSLGETVSKRVKKGDPLLVEGRLNHYSWKSKRGIQRSKTVVVVENPQFLTERKAE